MWKAVKEMIFSWEIWLGVIASFVIPLATVWINSTLRDWGNPPWLQKQKQPYYQEKKVRDSSDSPP